MVLLLTDVGILSAIGYLCYRQHGRLPGIFSFFLVYKGADFIKAKDE